MKVSSLDTSYKVIYIDIIITIKLILYLYLILPLYIAPKSNLSTSLK